MPFVAKCDFCGKAHRCRDTSHGKSINCKQCEAPFIAVDPQRRQCESIDTAKLPPRRKRRAKLKQKSESFDSGESDLSASETFWTSKNLMLVLGGCGVVFGAVAYFATPFIPEVMRRVMGLCAGVCMFVAHHQFCRYKIRAEIESFGGQVDSIQWRPFQGAFFSRGWHVQRIYTFFTVLYRERDGSKKDEMCGVSWIFGTRWDWD